MAVEGSVVQGGASAAVRHVDTAQQRDDDLGASQRVVGCSDVQRRLPVLVPRVHVSRVADQNSHRLLRRKVTEREFVFIDEKLKLVGDIFSCVCVYLCYLCLIYEGCT